MVGLFLIHVHDGSRHRSAVLLFVFVHDRDQNRRSHAALLVNQIFASLDRNGTGELVSAVENGRNLKQLDFLKAVSLNHRVELGAEGLVTDRPFLILTEESDGSESFTTLLAKQVELNLGVQATDAGLLHLGGETRIIRTDLVDLQNLTDGQVPVVRPDDTGVATVK